MVNLEQFVMNPGLQHLAENILLNLDPKTLENFRLVSKPFRQFIDGKKVFIKQRFHALVLTRDTKLERIANIPKYQLWDETFEGLIGLEDDILSIFKQYWIEVFTTFDRYKHLNDKNYIFSDWSPLHYACRNGYNEMVYYLMRDQRAKSMINIEGNVLYEGRFPLHIAFDNGNFEAVQYILDFYISDEYPKVPTDQVISLLYECIDHEYEDLVKLLLHQTKIIEYVDTKHFLDYAFKGQNTNIRIFEMVLESLLNSTDPIEKFGKKYLLYACENGKNELVKYLLTHHFIKDIIDINVSDYSGRTPFFFACLDGDLKLLEVILNLVNSNNLDIDFNARDRWGYTGVQKAHEWDHFEV